MRCACICWLVLNSFCKEKMTLDLYQIIFIIFAALFFGVLIGFFVAVVYVVVENNHPKEIKEETAQEVWERLKRDDMSVEELARLRDNIVIHFETNKQWHLRENPHGSRGPDDYELGA